MTPHVLFIIIIGILVFNFLTDTLLDYLNFKNLGKPLPEELQDVYNIDEYQKSQAYQKENFKFGLITATFSFLATLLFFFLDGFAWLDNLVRSVAQNEIGIALLFFGMLILANDIISLPFQYYQTFVIEEKFGFNKTTLKTFFLDKIKGWGLMAIMGGIILTALIWFYKQTGVNFWIYAWIIITAFTVFITFFYAKLIVPIFNKQTPLEDGALKNKITQYAKKVGFTLSNIFVIDGSKRSTKANAYFSGMGPQKRITLYDTLIHDLSENEIVAVLAHEVGHYKKKHVIINVLISTFLTGFTLWLLSLFINNPLLAEALHVKTPSFHIGLIVFGILYTPISEITGLLMNYLSRKFEYQADNFAKQTFGADALIAALKKLSKNSLSNLTPHPAYVFMHFSHPTLLQRIRNLKK
jgi:STE24 endopeptidase